ncbi:c-type cytochrome [Diaphorobacter sp. HDW4A]|uniref:c-type cytochrome n=1 Tax=Diaphorobacter sp. HDW4A TaxID=2714924 RepID=UPI001408685C|nr:cytochrome c [Diaphorobacter sp. HDW4A]QIL78530.1 c-type cytochrome [Diaphorobacter sp. HDW4A]
MRTLKKLFFIVLALLIIVIGGFFALTHQPAIEPAAQPAAGSFAPQQIEKGKLLAAMGDCAVCHTAPGGTKNTGGLPIASPFGTIYTTNITPDADTGIGGWSYEAFERAMRHGVNRDGQYLYPAFPYTSFTHVTDKDMKSLYAYLMTQPAVKHQPPKTALNFPFNVRPGIAAWNWMYLKKGPLPEDATKPPEWNRGAYIAEGLGHCSACHTPRDQFAGEKGGSEKFAGSTLDGWSVPALTSKTSAPMPWTADDLYAYFKHGFSPRHGSAAGPMAPVIHGLSQQSDADLKALSSYIMSFKDANAQPGDAEAFVAGKFKESKFALDHDGYRLFEGACASCHSDATGVKDSMFGVRPQLALNTNLYSDSPNNAALVVLNGIQEAATPTIGTMPAFRHNLSDAQIATLLNTMREQYGLKPWADLPAQVGKLRRDTAPSATRLSAH